MTFLFLDKIFDMEVRKHMVFYRRMPDENVLGDCIWKGIIDIVIVIIAGMFLAGYLCKVENVIGNSMSPVMKSEEKVFVDTMQYNIFSPDKGDVILFKVESKNGVTEKYMKRIIAVPGETVLIKDGSVYVNDKKIKTDDEIVNPGLAGEEIKLGHDEYFVLGDNYNNSEDSRFSSIGNVREEDIIGKVWLRVAPFARIGIV